MARGRTVPEQRNVELEERILDFLTEEGLFYITTPRGIGFVWDDELPPRDSEISESDDAVDAYVIERIEREGRPCYRSQSSFVVAAWKDWRRRVKTGEAERQRQ